MSMKPIKKAVCTVGKYTDRNGQEKNQYVTVGKLMKREDGSVCLKMDSVPVNFNGWINFYDLEENRPQQNANGMEQARAAAQPGDYQDDDIPF